MGRYPLKTAIGRYMKANKDYYSPMTIAGKQYVLTRIDCEYAKLRKSDPDLRGDPVKWGEREITAIILRMRERGLSHSSQAAELKILKGLLRFLGNGVMDTMRARMPHVFPRVESKRGRSLTEDELQAVLKATESLKGWKGEYLRFLIGTYAYTGLRLNELVMAERPDLDTKVWTLTVRHPKGERSYGERRTIPIPEPLKPVVARFLKERERVLAERGLLETRPLVFPENNPNMVISQSAVQKWKRELESLSGVQFTIHGLRRTYGQNLLNRGVPLESVSLALGHSSTLTTERHYCRKDADSARLEIVRAYESEKTPTVNSPQIDRRNDLPGYA